MEYSHKLLPKCNFISDTLHATKNPPVKRKSWRIMTAGVLVVSIISHYKILVFFKLLIVLKILIIKFRSRVGFIFRLASAEK